VQKSEKEQVVAELTERLRQSPTLIVADYRGLTNSEIDGLRGELLKHGAKFSVVKNTLTRIAAEAAGADALLALLEGPTAVAFIEAEGDPVAVAKALGASAQSTKILAVRGGVLEGRAMSADEVESLAKLPAADVLRGQVLGAIVAPLTSFLGLVNAPLQNLIGLIDARIDQLGGADAESAEAESGDAEPEAAAALEEAPAEAAEAAAEEPAAEAPSEPEASAEAEPPAGPDAETPSGSASAETPETTEE
jgi:large subunit ribosomal protein L10